MVPPYNDEHIIAGQGTIGLEILEDLPEVETVLLPVGGGGLISWRARRSSWSRPDDEVIGVETGACSRRERESEIREARAVRRGAGIADIGGWAADAEHWPNQF